jgi:hypothetical protein
MGMNDRVRRVVFIMIKGCYATSKRAAQVVFFANKEEFKKMR